MTKKIIGWIILIIIFLSIPVGLGLLLAWSGNYSWELCILIPVCVVGIAVGLVAILDWISKLLG